MNAGGLSQETPKPFAKDLLKSLHFLANGCTGLHLAALWLALAGNGERLAFIGFSRISWAFQLVGWPGLEPGTNGLKGRCSTD